MAGIEADHSVYFRSVRRCLAVTFGASLLASCSRGAESIDTASEPAVQKPESCSERLDGMSDEIAVTVIVEAGREVPVTLFVPDAPGTYPVIGFSHGAFASPARYRAMLAPLAAAGYIVVAPMHIDSEEFGSLERPTPEETWRTRNLDMALAISANDQIMATLEERGLEIDLGRIASVGHSYGAVIAQLPGGAVAIEPDGSRINRANPAVDVVVGWSPPGEVPGMISAEGWSALRAPTLTITGTSDILPGFIDDWRLHKASYENAPDGNRAVWVGEGIDHYFGGMFGRVKPAAPDSERLFRRALEVSLNFMDRAIDRRGVCALSEAVPGETYQED